MPFLLLRRWIFVVTTALSLLVVNVCLGQNAEVSGVILDATTREPVAFAAVWASQQGKGKTADGEGRFVLPCPNPRDSFSIDVSALGYLPARLKLLCGANGIQTILLSPKVTTTKEVEVIAGPRDRDLRAATLGMETITSKQAEELPSFFGEADMLKVLQLKPGVQNGGEGGAGIYVRGGGNDQNLMLLDGAPLYNAQHLYGFFSLFSPEAVDRVDLHKATFPAQHGGRLSSVMEFKLKEGDLQKHHASGGVGLLSSRLSLEGPIAKGKASYFISARRTYFDLFTRLYNKSQEGKADYTPIPDYYFYDLNAKLAWQLDKKNKLSLSLYHGLDDYQSTRDRFTFNFLWGNSMASLRWDHSFGKEIAFSAAAQYSRYSYRINNSFDNIGFELETGVEDATLRADWTWKPNHRHLITYGGQATHNAFVIGRTSATEQNEDLALSLGQLRFSQSAALYLGDDFSLTDRWQLNLGARLAMYRQPDVFYTALEPRLAVSYTMTDWLSVKGGYSRMTQFSHLVSSSGVALPTDFWYPAGKVILPQAADQVGAGFLAHFLGGNYVFSAEAYYKNLHNQVDVKDGATLFPNNQLDTVLTQGKGWAYGTEIYLEKRFGKTTGWIGYTLSWSWRQFDNINEGRAFHPRHDRRHDLSIVVRHQISKSLAFTGTFVFGTGNAITLPQGRVLMQDYRGTVPTPPGFSLIPQVRERNWYRMEPNMRMDLALVYKLQPKWGESDITFSIYNVLNRANPYFIYFENTTSGPNGTGFITGVRARQVSLFPIMPSLSYHFKF